MAQNAASLKVEIESGLKITESSEPGYFLFDGVDVPGRVTDTGITFSVNAIQHDEEVDDYPSMHSFLTAVDYYIRYSFGHYDCALLVAENHVLGNDVPSGW